MRKIYQCIFLFTVLLIHQSGFGQDGRIRVNQIGYLEDDVKVAVWISKENRDINSFELIDADTGQPVFRINRVKDTGQIWGFDSSARLDFSGFKTPGTYLVQVGNIFGYNLSQYLSIRKERGIKRFYAADSYWDRSQKNGQVVQPAG